MQTVSKLVLLAGLVVGCVCLHGQDVPTTVTPQTSDPGTVLPTTLTQSNTSQTAPAAATDKPAAAAEDQSDEDVAPVQAPLTPNASHEIVDADEIYVVHLRPLYTTLIRLPEEVTSIAVGAPTLIAAEHSPNEPKLVFVKPTTHQPVDSDIIIALRSGRTLAVRVISAGDAGSSDPVDFVVDYSSSMQLMLSNDDISGAADVSLFQQPDGSNSPPEATLGHAPAVQLQVPARGRQKGVQYDPQGNSPEPSAQVTNATPVAEFNPGGDSSGQPASQTSLEVASTAEGGEASVPVRKVAAPTLLDQIYNEQQEIAAPHYTTAEDLARVYVEDRFASSELGASLGRCQQEDDKVVVSYSIINRSKRWIEILPPILEFNNPATAKKGKVDKKHPEALAEQVQVLDFRMTGRKLAPGQRLDGAVEFVRPDFKYKKEHLLLQIADASQVDTALLVPIPFVVPSR